MAGREVDIEPGDEGVDVVIASCSEAEWDFERQVRSSDGVEVESDDGTRVADQGLELNSIDEGLGESNILHGRIVEAVDIVPD